MTRPNEYELGYLNESTGVEAEDTCVRIVGGR